MLCIAEWQGVERAGWMAVQPLGDRQGLVDVAASAPGVARRSGGVALLCDFSQAVIEVFLCLGIQQPAADHWPTVAAGVQWLAALPMA